MDVGGACCGSRTAAVAVVVLVVAPFDRTEPAPEAEAGTAAPTTASVLDAGSPRGSLADDAAFVEAVRRLPWTADERAGPALGIRSVVFVGDVPGGRWALVVGEVLGPPDAPGSPADGPAGQSGLMAVWFGGRPGADPAELRPLTAPMRAPADVPLALLDQRTGTMVVVAASGRRGPGVRAPRRPGHRRDLPGVPPGGDHRRHRHRPAAAQRRAGDQRRGLRRGARRPDRGARRADDDRQPARGGAAGPPRRAARTHPGQRRRGGRLDRRAARGTARTGPPRAADHRALGRQRARAGTRVRDRRGGGGHDAHGRGDRGRRVDAPRGLLVRALRAGRRLRARDPARRPSGRGPGAGAGLRGPRPRAAAARPSARSSSSSPRPGSPRCACTTTTATSSSSTRSPTASSWSRRPRETATVEAVTEGGVSLGRTELLGRGVLFE